MYAACARGKEGWPAVKEHSRAGRTAPPEALPTGERQLGEQSEADDLPVVNHKGASVFLGHEVHDEREEVRPRMWRRWKWRKSGIGGGCGAAFDRRCRAGRGRGWVEYSCNARSEDGTKRWW